MKDAKRMFLKNLVLDDFVLELALMHVFIAIRVDKKYQIH